MGLHRWLFLLLLLFSARTWSQSVIYSPLEVTSERSTTFEVIGRSGKTIYVQTYSKGKYTVVLYNNEMKPIRRVPLNFVVQRPLKVDYVLMKDNLLIIFQTAKENMLYSHMIHLNAEGKMASEPRVIDSLPITGPNLRTFDVLYSTNRKMVMLLHQSAIHEQLVQVHAHLLDDQVSTVRRSIMYIVTPDGEEMVRNYALANSGDLVFTRVVLRKEEQYYERIDVMVKPPIRDTVYITPVFPGNIHLREISLQVDDAKRKVILAALYGSGKRRHVNGVYSSTVDLVRHKIMTRSTVLFGDTLRQESKTPGYGKKITFNDFSVDEIIPNLNGGYAVMMERKVKETVSGSFRNYNNLMGINSFARTSYESYIRPSDPRGYVTNIAGHVLMMDLDSAGNMRHVEVIRKYQVENNTSNLISYQTLKSEDGLEIIYNQRERGGNYIGSVSWKMQDGLRRKPNPKGQINRYRYMPRYAVQTGIREAVIPCTYRGYICFARVFF